LAGALVAIAAVLLGVIGMVRVDKSGTSKATAVWRFILGLVFIVAGFALVGYYELQANEVNQCLSDLIACAQQH
jgi:uncharacterized protein involved in response to NO